MIGQQINIFELSKPQYKITKPIRLIELFAGIGSQAKALENLNANFENYRVIEFDKYAIASYNTIHGTNFATQDITQISGSDLGIVDTDKYEYILTYSFPCQDLSLAGKRKGMAKGDNTRSGLLWEVERLLEECCGFKEHRIPPSSRSKIHSMSDWVDDYNYDIDNTKLPQVLLMENVPQVISRANISDFQKWQYKLEQLGYSNYVQLLNAKDYGIPQNRNRCFMVSILGDFYYGFPRKQKLKLRLKDMLEDEVDEKYYLSERALKGVLNTTFECSKLENRLPKNDIIPTLCARDYKDPKLILVGNMEGGKCDKIYESARKVYSEDGLAPTIHTCQGGNTEPKVAIKEYANYITWEDSKGRLNTQDHRAFMPERISGTVPAMERGVPKILIPEATKQGYAIPEGLKTAILPIVQNKEDHTQAIRKLTPKECWRLMGFSDEDFEKASKVNSNAQPYKQAGNSIVVNVLEAIFKELL